MRSTFWTASGSMAFAACLALGCANEDVTDTGTSTSGSGVDTAYGVDTDAPTSIDSQIAPGTNTGGNLPSSSATGSGSGIGSASGAGTGTGAAGTGTPSGGVESDGSGTGDGAGSP